MSSVLAACEDYVLPWPWEQWIPSRCHARSPRSAGNQS